MRIGVARNGPWILSCDFSELVDPQEKLGGNQRTVEDSKDFIQMPKACGV